MSDLIIPDSIAQPSSVAQPSAAVSDDEPLSNAEQATNILDDGEQSSDLSQTTKRKEINIDQQIAITLTIEEQDGTIVQFQVDREDAFNHCAFFKQAIEKSGIPEYHLKNTTSQAVKFLIEFLHSEHLNVQQVEDNLKYDDHPKEWKAEDLALVEIWALAEQLQLPGLQDLAIMKIHEVFYSCGGGFSCSVVRRVYEVTEGKCYLRDYFVAMCLGDNQGRDEDWPKQIFIDMLDLAVEKLNLVTSGWENVYLPDYYCVKYQSPN